MRNELVTEGRLVEDLLEVAVGLDAAQRHLDNVAFRVISNRLDRRRLSTCR